MLVSLQAIERYRKEEGRSAVWPEWLQILASAEERVVNLERVRSLRELSDANPVLDYVEKSLRTLEGLRLSFWVRELLEEVLVWSETAKGGTVRQRLRWQESGVNLFVHNEGSAQLYREHQRRLNHNSPGEPAERTEVVETLIATHGLIGQYIRGEVPFSAQASLTELVRSGRLSPSELRSLLLPLNECVLTAVSPELWQQTRGEVEAIVDRIAQDREDGELSLKERMRRLRSGASGRGENFEAAWAKVEAYDTVLAALDALADKTLWYVEPAFRGFSLDDMVKCFLLALRSSRGDCEVRHISFEPLMQSMYYDHKGLKKINVYKQRVIEKYVRELSFEHILQDRSRPNPHLTERVECKPGLGDTLFFTFEFSRAAEKLIEFCVEAEKSALYEKAVLMLFDLFELRRDAYDRFHNEEDYLSAMNSTADYKQLILNYVVGETVLDIGPGGGVLLDLIEERLPGKRPVGIDISANVIEALERRKQLEGRTWEVRKGDALRLEAYMEPGSVDTVIFSSILHELYSYIPFEGKKFNRATIGAALRSAFGMLKPGGRIIIRDGIMSEPVTELRRIRLLREDGLLWLERYARDFQGRSIRYTVLDQEARTVEIPVNDAMEFLYTYTWGPESYVHEVQEQFGYFTPGEYEAFIRETLGREAKLLESRHFLQEGYTEALSDKIEFMDADGNEVPLPDSTCLFVIEKVGR
ncbi:Methyltransferase domain-containing protein [Paenibacillus sp. UNCCL117]|uniref:class I SAM-dependent methyltransferase n=1 Tax=unclassified Paenibacillus TaxID=185978 RepID=UPI000890AD90|nr:MULTISPECIES: class I SAM-dependent methyltransferase [unclassified Paenibacillus]SDE65784.1 Methyltransferase domain-containing protein [Paenibacillus sp. cl123]SFW70379.1 Methyltransferase domain-containing protein [Paenibacillus sp. UNCCL117]